MTKLEPFNTKRLATDAKILLINAGYALILNDTNTNLFVFKLNGDPVARLEIRYNCVDNVEVEKLLAGAK